MILRSLFLASACAGMLALTGCAEEQARSDAKPASTAADSKPVADAKSASPFDKPGFVTGLKDGRLWVFQVGTKEAEAFQASGATPARHVVRPGAGPAGMTIRGPENEVLLLYVATKPGYEVIENDGRLWVFRAGTKEHDEFKAKGSFPARHVVRPGAGPLGATVRSPEASTIDEYLLTKPGFAVYEREGRFWIYKEGSKEHEEFLAKKSHPARHVVRPGAGPNGETLRSPENLWVDEYLVAQEGFVTAIKEERLWVFQVGTKEASDFAAKGSLPARHVVRPGAGPNRMTVRAPEFEVIDSYRRAAGLN